MQGRLGALQMVLLVLVAAVLPACGGGSGSGAGIPSAQPFRKARGPNGMVSAILLTSNGAYLAGSFNLYDDTATGRIARVDRQGNLDPGFFTGTGFSSNVTTLCADANGGGRIYAGGTFSLYNGSPAGRIARLLSGGSLDVTFVTGSGFNNSVQGIAAAADGSGDIYVVGTFSSYNGAPCANIVRLNSDGSLDSAFAAGTGFTGGPFTVVPARDGSGDVYVGGQFSKYQGVDANCIIRLNSNGSIDAGFAIGTGFDNRVWAVAVDPVSGDVYVGGDFAVYNGTLNDRIVRLNPDGTVDGGFSTGSGAAPSVRAITIDSSGRVLVGGTFQNYNGTDSPYYVRLTSGGAVDKAFPAATGFDNTVLAVAAATDGSQEVLIGGAFSSFDGAGRNHFVWTTDAGAAIPGLRPGSEFSTPVYALGAADDGTGDLYVGGSFTAYNGFYSPHLVRLHADGSVNPSFATGTGFNFEVYAVTAAKDGTGRIYVGGFFTSFNGTPISCIARLNPDGSLDPTFNQGTGFSSSVRAIVRADDGSGDIYVGGDFDTYNTVTAGAVVRLNSDGSLDAGFATGSGASATVSAILLAADGSGDIYIGGSFQFYNAIALTRIARINSNGSADLGFDMGTGFDGSVLSLARAGDGSGDIYAGGLFSTYSLVAVEPCVRLHSSGARDASFAPVGLPTTRCILPLGDGTGDLFLAGSSSGPLLMRVNADGSVDPALSVGTGTNGDIYAALAGPQGSYYIAGGFTSYDGHVVGCIAHVYADGALDH